MNPGRRSAVALVVVLSSTSMARLGAAQSAGSPPAATPPRDLAAPRSRVIVRIAGSDEEARALEASLRELGARLALTVDATRVAPTDLGAGPPLAADVLAVVRVDLSVGAPASVAVGDPKYEARRTRRTVPRDRPSDVVVDELAHVVFGAVEELVLEERERHKAPPPEPPKAEPPKPAAEPKVEPSVPPPSAPPTESSGFGVDVGPYVAGRALGDGAGVSVGGGALVGFAVDRRSRAWPELVLAGAYFTPVDVSGTLADTHVAGGSARLAAIWSAWRSEAVRLDVGPTGGVEIVSAEARSTALPASRLRDVDTEPWPFLGGLALARFGVASTADIFAGLAVDVDVAPRRYVVKRGPETERIFSPWRVRPSFSFGFTLAFGGPEPYRIAREEKR